LLAQLLVLCVVMDKTIVTIVEILRVDAVIVAMVAAIALAVIGYAIFLTVVVGVIKSVPAMMTTIMITMHIIRTQL
jgi:hypothetical protein